MKLQCVFAGVMAPDYWLGCDLPHVAVYVWPDMTMRELRAAIEAELRHGHVMGSTRARLLSDDVIPERDVPDADKLTRAAYAAVRRDVRARGRPFHDLPHDAESYAYFIFREG